MNQHTQSHVAASLAPFSDAELASELLRRSEEREHRKAVARAVEILREIPEALNPKWTVNKLCDLAIAHDLPATAAFAAWESLTASISKDRISNATVPGGFTVGQRVRDTESHAVHTVLGAGALTNHVLVRFDTANRDGLATGEFHMSYLEAVAG